MTKLLPWILVLSLAACATTIGNKAEISEVTFSVNQTTKSEVADKLGLPAKINKKENEAKEYWYYTSKAKLSGLMIAVPSPAGPTVMADTYTLPVDAGTLKSTDYAVAFVFDNNNKLIEVVKREN